MMVVVSEKVVAMAKGEGMCEAGAGVLQEIPAEIERGQDRRGMGDGFGREEKEWAVVPMERTI